MMRYYLFFLLSLCLFPLSVSAESLHIATIDLPPYGFLDGKEATGLCYELGNAIAREAGLEPENQLLPLARGMKNIANGSADMIIMLPNKEISVSADNLGPILPSEIVVFGLAQTPLRTVKDLRGKVVAFVRGSRYFTCNFSEIGAILYPLHGYEQGLKMLLNKRVDAVMGPKLGLYYTAQKTGLPRRAFGRPLTLCAAQGSVFLSKKVDSAVAARISAAVEHLVKTGRVQQLIDKYSLEQR
ncbi:MULTISPECIES: transporter substrate-binding domain-containing protein [unclassified Pseudodesulfovibrio]|uniref:substrate-binding periplasmic protein n=1 Tax=unclassified Pseudodesulfovibrio TaxID=2661612 RepID=UPI000FEC1079|nr:MULTISPECIES: transporter substrate-binding domain-containing protein [unclassified Pseudodesulfovibrio]MCJ2165659.1 transporter substrate-binding domain-containing protein [Pseudodesulfovibrio sp. S3-i]RWU02925.1 hypothetical protein DWB63_13550 [Pseudodesulfovibrio sp. S3]